MSADRTTRYSSATRCGHCGNVAPMFIVASYADTVVDEYPDGPPVEHGTIYEVLKCPACREVLLRSYFWNDMMESEGDVTFRLLYPYDARMPLGLPEPIEKAYRAAIKVKSIDANAFGVLVGRAVEMVCSDRGASGDTLHKKLKDLAERGEIPTKLVDVADKLRALRNVGAHAELGELTPEEVPIVEDLCRAILDYIYTAPYLAQRAEESLARLIKKDRRTENSKQRHGSPAKAPPSTAEPDGRRS